MDIRAKVAVVTGAGNGIGEALSRALAAAGCRVVVADLDRVTAQLTAEEILRDGGDALAAEADVADKDAIRGLVDLAEQEFGPVDLYFANAGVVEGAGLSDDIHWSRAVDVNLMAHVRAAQVLVPAWLERGQGYFISTASAAGLLSQVGLAPYSATKHAAVGFAEWLAITYGRRGLRVSCICPMGVATRMHSEGLEGAGDDRLAARVVDFVGPILSPGDVADVVLASVERERFLILPHPEVHEFLRDKASDPEAWVVAMQRLQARLEEPSADHSF